MGLGPCNRLTTASQVGKERGPFRVAHLLANCRCLPQNMPRRPHEQAPAARLPQKQNGTGLFFPHLFQIARQPSLSFGFANILRKTS